MTKPSVDNIVVAAVEAACQLYSKGLRGFSLRLLERVLNSSPREAVRVMENSLTILPPKKEFMRLPW
jgi:hypothetical protein